jgi:hypothetical protein
LRNVSVEFWGAETKTIPHPLVKLGMKRWSIASCGNVEKMACSGEVGDDDDQGRTEQSLRQIWVGGNDAAKVVHASMFGM